MSALTDRLKHELTVMKAEGLPSMYVKLEDMEALLGEAKAVGAVPELTDAQIDDVLHALDCAALDVCVYEYGLPNHGDHIPNLRAAVRAALASSPALPEQGWISVKDELPPEGPKAYRVIAVCVKQYGADTNYAGQGIKGVYQDWVIRLWPHNFQYWMRLLPTPPAAKEQEKQNG